MTRAHLAIAFAAAVALLAACHGDNAEADGGQGRTFYVNFDAGNDRADGRTAATAWRHAPGDPQAAGAPAATVLGPGDTVLLAPNVRYRGALQLNTSGAPGKPILIGSAPGQGQAIIDGSDPAVFMPCPDQAACGGVENWRSLSRIEFKAPAPAGAQLFTNAGPLSIAQFPDPRNAFYPDEIDDFLKVDGRDLEDGRVPLPAGLAAALNSPGEREVALWVFGNQVRHRSLNGIDRNAALFSPSGLKFYQDRPSRIALIAHPALISQDGEYAFVEGRRAAIAYLPAGTTDISIASGRGGVDLGGQSFIQIRNLAFENMADDGSSVGSGQAVRSVGKASRDIKIAGSTFRNFHMELGQGPITIQNADTVDISRNHIDGVRIGSGMRISRSNNVSVKENEISRVGRTGIMILSTSNTEVSYNRLVDLKGVHGNGISIYLDSQNVAVNNNTVLDATRPLTIKGEDDSQAPNTVTVRNNIFIGTPDSQAAISSWGDMKSAEIQGNIAMGGKVGYLPSPKDTGVSVRNNVLSALPRNPVAGTEIPASENAVVDFQVLDKAAIAKLMERPASADGKVALPKMFCTKLSGLGKRDAAAGAGSQFGSSGAC